MKINSTDGTIIWSRMYNNNLNPTSTSNRVADVVVNNFTNCIYLASMTTDAHIVKLDKNGNT